MTGCGRTPGAGCRPTREPHTVTASGLRGRHAGVDPYLADYLGEHLWPLFWLVPTTAEYLAALALFIVILTTSDFRYRYRLAVSEGFSKSSQKEPPSAWRHALMRRSQRNRLSWDRFQRLLRKYLPPCRLLHPHPDARFAVKTSDRSRMR